MRLFFILMLLAGKSHGYNTVKNIEGIKIPRGISAQYDKFEALYIIKPKNADSTSANLILSYMFQPPFIETYVEIGFDTIDDFVDADEIDIFIENSESNFKKHTLNWAQKTVTENITTEDTSRTRLLKIFDLEEFSSGERKSSKLIREFSRINDSNLFAFFLENFNSDSFVTMRFKNTSTGRLINIEVEEKELIDLWNMIQLYRSLTVGAGAQ